MVAPGPAFPLQGPDSFQPWVRVCCFQSEGRGNPSSSLLGVAAPQPLCAWAGNWIVGASSQLGPSLGLPFLGLLQGLVEGVGRRHGGQETGLFIWSSSTKWLPWLGDLKLGVSLFLSLSLFFFCFPLLQNGTEDDNSLRSVSAIKLCGLINLRY